MSKGKIGLGVGILAIAGIAGGVWFLRSRGSLTPPAFGGFGMPPPGGNGNPMTGERPVSTKPAPTGKTLGIPLPGGRKGERVTVEDVNAWTSAAKGFWNTVTEVKQEISG